MSLLVKRNGGLFPSLLTDLFETDRLFSPDLLDRSALSAFSRIPSVNVRETEKDFQFEIAAPGLTKKDFKVEVENGVLTISSEKEEEKKEEKQDYTRREFSYNSFIRSFRLPENTKTDTVDAKYDNGILKIVVPKKEVTVIKKKEIAVA